MKTSVVILFISLLLILGALAACQPPPLPTPHPTPTPIAYDFQDAPEHVIASYFNALNRQEYRRAYDYREDHDDLFYPAFVAHYSNMSHTLAVVREPIYYEGAAGSFYSMVPTLMLTTNFDGSLHVYHACYTTHRLNPDAAGHDTKWFIYSSTETEVDDADPWSALGACPDFQDSAPLMPEWEYDIPEHLLGSYVYAITHQDYQTAYDYWEFNPLTFAQFVARYADTQRMDILVALPVREEGAAGSMYARAPTLMLETKNDGSKYVFKTCFTTRLSNVEPDSHWMIYDSTSTPLDAWILADGCN